VRRWEADEFKVEGFVVEAVGGRVTVTMGRSGEGKKEEGGGGGGTRKSGYFRIHLAKLLRSLMRMLLNQ
jgi:hypothetical protein